MSLQTTTKLDETSATHIYYDLDVINNDTTGTNAPLPLSFVETRNSPYLKNPSLYYISVARFQLQTPSLPIFLPQAQINQNNINKTIYSFTLTYNGFEQQEYVIYVPSDSSQPLPSPPIEFQEISSNYYFIYCYQQWVDMLNTTLQTAWTNLNTKVVLPSPNAPFFEFDPIAQVMILNADAVGYANTAVNQIKIFANAPCFNLLSSFPALYFGYNNITNGKNFQFTVKSINGTNELILPSYTALQMYQEGSTTALWNPVQKLCFTTALLPVVNELVAVPRVFNSDSNLFANGNNANVQPILTDFVVNYSPSNTYKPNVEYTPSGEYRLMDLYGNSSLSSIQINVYWVDVFGGQHPFYLNSQCSGSIKLLFRRRDYNNTTLF